MGKRRFGSIEKREDRGGRVYVKFRYQGEPEKRVSGWSEEDADRKLLEVEEMIAEGYTLEMIDERVFGRHTGRKVTFLEIAPEYLASVECSLKPSTLREHEYKMGVLCAASWARMPLKAITVHDINRWKERRKREVKVSTVNRDLSLGSCVFLWAQEQGWVDHNPFRMVRRAKEKEFAKELWLTSEEWRHILEAASPAFYPVVLCAGQTGMRRGEIMALTWRYVDLRKRVITVEKSTAKGKKTRNIPIPSELRRVLSEIRRNRPENALSDLVFRSVRGGPLYESFINREWERLRKRCTDVEAPRLAATTLHTLRHTYASHLLQEGVTIQEIAHLLGHGTAYIAERYAAFVPKDTRIVRSILDDRLGTDDDRVRDASRPVDEVLELAGLVPVSVPAPSRILVVGG